MDPTCLVQNDNLEGRAGLAVGALATGRQLGKVLDLVADNLDAALVGGVQLQDSLLVHVPKEVPEKCEVICKVSLLGHFAQNWI